MKNSEALLVGGAGFIGAHLARNLSSDGWKVAILDRVAPTKGVPGCEVISGELRDTRVLRDALGRYSRVIYLAHEARAAPAADRLPANFINNLELFLLVLQESISCGLKEFTLFSSGGAVYGEPLTTPISEDAPANPVSPYGIAKLTMEKYLAMAASREGFRHLCLRPANPYGPDQNFNGAQGIVAVSMARVARRQEVKIFGDGSTTKDYLFIDDLTAAVVSLLQSPTASGVFNIGSGIGLSVAELLDLIAAAVGKRAVLKFEHPLVGDVSRNVLGIQKITAATGWQPATAIHDGLAKTWDWMRPLL